MWALVSDNDTLLIVRRSGDLLSAVLYSRGPASIYSPMNMSIVSVHGRCSSINQTDRATDTQWARGGEKWNIYKFSEQDAKLQSPNWEHTYLQHAKQEVLQLWFTAQWEEGEPLTEILTVWRLACENQVTIFLSNRWRFWISPTLCAAGDLFRLLLRPGKMDVQWDIFCKTR